MTRILHKLSLLFVLLTVGTIAKGQNIQELCLFNTDFTEWEKVNNSSSEQTVEKKTAFTKESLTFTLLNNEVNPTGTNSKFNEGTVGWMMAAKDPNTYVITSPLASITKVIFTHGATGSNRGYKLEVKGDGDADWVVVSNSIANPAAGVTVTANVNRKNCQLRFTNLTTNQNAYMFDLKIYGNVDMSTISVSNLTTKSNPADAGNIKNIPAGTLFEKDAEVTLTQTPNFGYQFVNWTDGNGNVLGSNESLVVKLSGDMTITANYQSVNTYELALTPTNGAADYMIQLNPAPHMDGKKKMYEEGTKVTLTATNNQILTFTSWSDGTTANSTTVTMNSNQAITANYEAADYIAGWDFYKSGCDGRSADFFAKNENESASLILRKADGATASWLDKSYEAAKGYEGRNAAVNWKALSHKYYYQIWVDASEYKDIKVSAEMLLNFNAYTVQKVQYSFDNETWKDLGTITLKEKEWTEGEFALPSEADYMPKVYIRWIPDYESAIAGSASDNDGTSIANIFVFGTSSIQDNGKAPELLSSVPSEGTKNASATGQIVLTFNEKIQLTENAKATLNGEPISISVVGKTLTASYKKLPYNTAQVFTLEGGSVSDMTNNVLNEAVTIHFTTMDRPKVDKKPYDKVVSTVEEFKEALRIANSIKSTYRIFMHDGTYDLGSTTLTTISGYNISLIGESMEGTVIVNKPTVEGIGETATLLNTGQNLYLQDITLKNAYDYTGSTGRAVCLQDKGNKTIAKRVKLLSYQDTYYSNSQNRFYWEDSEIHGTVDYLCGGGDVYYNRCLFYMEDRSSGDVLAAPNKPLKYGYVFLDCTIDGADSQKGKYNLARPWADQCRAQFINTTMKILPSATGYTEMGDGNAPAVFAEYNSMTSSGNIVDLSGRKTKYIYNEGALVKEAGHSPVLTKEEADALSIDIVMGGTDNWDPRVATEQADAPENVKLTGTSLTWDDNDYVLCWAICKDGAVIDFTTTNSYTVTDTNAKYSVRAANEKGGLSNATEANSSTGIEEVVIDQEVVKTTYYNTAGCQVNAKTKGVIIEVKTLKDGKKKSSKILN
ncbi:MAG: Ig-like domain-containing protein [Prevotella sp.]|nr:Ig-like domain-containing protein [Prevotella sp.]